MADGLLKHAILARSGIYQYTLKQLKDSGLADPPEGFPKLELYNVLRPAPVLAAAVAQGKFDRIPLTVKHPPELVTRDSFRDYITGWTGDHATMDWLDDEKEVGIAAEVNLKDAEAIDSYNRGVKEISPGYGAHFAWKLSQYKGQPVHAIMTDISDVNHASMVPRGRGGAASAILDHGEGNVNPKQMVSGLLRQARIRIFALAKGLVKDSMGPIAGEVAKAYENGFEQGLYNLIDTRATLTEEEISKKIDELSKLIDDLPGGDEKSLITKYMSDMKLMKDLKNDELFAMKNIICSLIEKVDKKVTDSSSAADADGKPDLKDCPMCDGTGKYKDASCDACNGSGKIMDKTTKDSKLTTDEPGPVGSPGAPAAAPAGTAPASPAAPAGAAPAQGPKKTPQQWADELFTFLDAMRADLQSAAKPAAAAPGAAPAGGQPAATPTGAPAAVPAGAAPGTAPAPAPAPASPAQPAGAKPPGEAPKTTDEKPGSVADAMPSATAKVDTGASPDKPTGIRAAFAEVNRR
jgi:hypothetical protein